MTRFSSGFWIFASDTVVSLWFFGKIQPDKKRFSFQEAAALAAVLPIFLYLFIMPWKLQFWFRFAYRVGVEIFILRFVFGVKRERAAYFAVLAAAVCTACQNVFSTPVLYHITQELLPGQWASQGMGVGIAFKAAFQFAVFFVVEKCLPASRIYRPSRAEWLVLLLIVLSELYVKQTLYEITQSGKAQNTALTTFALLLQIAQLCFLVYFERYINEEKRQKELQIQEITNRYRLQSLRQKSRSDEALRALNHDIKNHLYTIRRLSAAAQNDQISDYIGGLLQEAESADILANTGNAVLDGLLSEKMAQAENSGIEMDVLMDFSQIDFLDDRTLCTLFGNLLDNALEACLKVGEEKARRIQVRSSFVAGQLQITVTNSCQGKIRLVDGLPETTKKKPEEHGIGLRNVRRTLKQYGGILMIDTSVPQRFTCTMLIPVPQG